MKSVIVFLFISGVLVLPSDSAWCDDDADSPSPVSVKTKRASLGDHSLPHLIDLTEEHSPRVQQARNARDIARLDYEIAGKNWLPSLNLVSSGGLSGTDPNTRPMPWASTLDVRVSEKFYDNGVSVNRYSAAKRAFERRQLEFELARDKQFLDMTSAYYDWSAVLQQNEILQNKRDLLRRQFNVLESQYKQGLKAKRDVLRIETEIRRLELSVIASDSDVDLDFQKLSSFVGMNRADLEREGIESEEAKPYLPPDERPKQLLAADHRLAKINALKEQEASLAARLVQRDYWPQVAVDGSFGYTNYDFIENPAAKHWDANHAWDWRTMLTLTYNIWDFGARGKKVESARITERDAADQTRQILFDLGNELRNVSLQIQTLRESVRMTKELLVLEQQSYAILDAEYRLGRATYLDLITNLNTLIDARSKFIDSYFNLKKQLAIYSYHQGDLYDVAKKQ